MQVVSRLSYVQTLSLKQLKISGLSVWDLVAKAIKDLLSIELYQGLCAKEGISLMEMGLEVHF